MTTKGERYELCTGRFGHYFRDQVAGRELALLDVLSLLNARAEQAEALLEAERLNTIYQKDLQKLRAERCDYEEDQRDANQQMVALREKLAAAQELASERWQLLAEIHQLSSGEVTP